MPTKLKELTYSGDFRHLGENLFYDSDRTVVQYKLIKKHPMCRMGMGFVKVNLPDVPFMVVCDDEDVKAITTKMFKKIWRRMVFEAMDMLDFGFKCMEILYEVGTIKYENESEVKKEFTGTLLKQPRGIDPETVDMLIFDNGDLKGFNQQPDIKVLLEENKALIFTNNYQSGNWFGESEYDYIYQEWFDSILNRQFGMRWLERKGTGLFQGRYPSGKTDVSGKETENSTIMLDLLDSIMEGTVVALPSDRDENGEYKWDMLLMEGSDKTDSFIAKDEYLDKKILLGLMVPERAVTQGEMGAKASVEAFQSLFIQRKQDVLDEVVETINEQLLPAFIEPNFGDVECRIEAGQLDDDSRIRAGEIIAQLLTSGNITVDTEWLEKKSGIPLEEQEVPEPLVEEEIVVDEEEPEETEEAKEADKPEPAKKLSVVRLASGIDQDISYADRIYRMESLAEELEVRKSEFEAEMAIYFKEQEIRISEYLRRNAPEMATGKYVKVVNDISLKKAPLRKIVHAYDWDVYNMTDTSLQAGIGTSLKLAETPGSVINFRSNLAIDKLITDIESEIKFGVSYGVNNEYSLTQIIDSFTKKVGEMLKIRVPIFAGTESGFMLNQARLDFIKNNKKMVKSGTLNPSKLITRLVYSAIIDGRTTVICRSLNGIVVDVNSPVVQQYNPPLHYNCRSTWLPITEEMQSSNPANTKLTLDKRGKPVMSDQVTSALGDVKVGKSGKTALDEKTFI